MNKLLVLCIAALLAVASRGSAAFEQIVYYHDDIFGSPIAETDASGNVVWKETYAPYGDRTKNQDQGSNEVWFHGKPADIESGLSYFGARYYDPAVGRFMGTDLAGFDEANLESFNKYAYGNNNPYRYRDPNGKHPIDLFFLAVDVGALVVAIHQGGDVTSALVDVGLSAASVINPIPLVGEALKAARTTERLTKAASNAESAVEAAKRGTTLANDLAAAATRAADAVGPGSGAVYGTRVHSAFEAEVNGLGRESLNTKISYLNGQIVSRGTPGSVRLDVVNGSPNAPISVFDLKTGSATLMPGRIQQIQSHVPGGAKIPVFEVRP